MVDGELTSTVDLILMSVQQFYPLRFVITDQSRKPGLSRSMAYMYLEEVVISFNHSRIEFYD